MILLALFFLGVLLLVLGILFLFFPKSIDDLSAWMSQVVINTEDSMLKWRRPAGIVLFLLGAWLVWLALTIRNVL